MPKSTLVTPSVYSAPAGKPELFGGDPAGAESRCYICYQEYVSKGMGG